jgi:hypothetical protein
MSISNIKKKCTALKLIGRSPSQAIKEAWRDVEANCRSVETSTGHALALVDGFISDIIAIAEDMEKPKAEGEAKA